MILDRPLGRPARWFPRVRFNTRLFPKLTTSYYQLSVPTLAYVDRTRRFTHITLDTWFPPVEWSENVAALYCEYVRWWQMEAQAKRVPWPRNGLMWGATMRDYIGITVLREHEAWWTGLFEASVGSLMSYAEERQRRKVRAVAQETSR